jgi:hypothetical protein
LPTFDTPLLASQTNYSYPSLRKYSLNPPASHRAAAVARSSYLPPVHTLIYREKTKCLLKTHTAPRTNHGFAQGAARICTILRNNHSILFGGPAARVGPVALRPGIAPGLLLSEKTEWNLKPSNPKCQQIILEILLIFKGFSHIYLTPCPVRTSLICRIYLTIFHKTSPRNMTVNAAIQSGLTSEVHCGQRIA